MIPTRQAMRARSTLPTAARCARVPRNPQMRFQSTASSSSSTTGASSSGATRTVPSSVPWAAGVLGGVVGATLFLGVYSYTPSGRTASALNKAVFEAEKKYQVAAKKIQQKTPSADEAVDSIKQLAYSYVGWVPGGRAYVDVAFKDLDTVREKHKDEADKIVNDAYKQFQEVSKSGLSLATATRAYEVLADLAQKIASLAGDAISDIIDNHPKVKEKLGGNVDQLKQLSEKYGPEAKKQVDETWKQVKDIFAGGFSEDNIAKARKLVQDKVQEVRKLGDQAWNKAYEEAKPLLEKNPKVKELVEQNADALKQGNAKELFDKAKSAIDSGNLGDLEGYVKSAADKVKSSGGSGWGSLEQYAKMLPHGDQVIPKLKELAEVSQKHGEKGEQLVKETLDELKQVLEKKSKKAEEIVNEAKKDAKDAK